MFGVGGDVGYGGCEPRIEGNVQKGIVQYKENEKMWGGGGEGEGQYLNPKHFLCILNS